MGATRFDRFGMVEPEAENRFVEPHHTRTKDEYPYSFDPFFIFGTRSMIKGVGADYTDRLHGWDSKKYVALCEKHLAKRQWRDASKKELEAFFSDWNGYPTTVVALAEGCDGAGYPHWIIWHRKTE